MNDPDYCLHQFVKDLQIVKNCDGDCSFNLCQMQSPNRRRSQCKLGKEGLSQFLCQQKCDSLFFGNRGKKDAVVVDADDYNNICLCLFAVRRFLRGGVHDRWTEDSGVRF
jgi:hypothetical protein